MAYAPLLSSALLDRWVGEDRRETALSSALSGVLAAAGLARLGLSATVRKVDGGFRAEFRAGDRRREAAIPADLVRGGRWRAAAAAPGLYEWFVREALESARPLTGAGPEPDLPAEGREAARGLLAMAAALSELEGRGYRVLPRYRAIPELFAFGGAVAVFGCLVRLHVGAKLAFAAFAGVLVLRHLLRPKGLLLKGPARNRLRLTDRVDGTAYTMEIVGPGGVRRIALDLGGCALADLPARLPALAREALTAVGL